MQHINVRPATGADLAALRELFLATRRQAYTWMAGATFELADLERQTQGETMLVAQNAEGALAGFVSVWEADHFIHHLYVDYRQHRRGIGRALLAALPGWPLQAYSLKCLCRNHAAAAFYRACGFVQTGSGTAEDGDYLVFQSGGGAGRRS
ncbi:GNAT family N-acetyltransferase [Janthinobacterium agaricidamnosum]|uniref:Acetyltransferase family protein n=1 Tax=Janthinobacterium agaricidamnosum NBRC 102515 = DSM 9628 TaxID=1349767 RepID=W0V385_9BURK|nr:GNAT family N-acetyltransferase [Janthinobacterium agaricidamnosum]CDG82045.1 acetyltransferase family protein [Janthinobacterium agaricidamnosum NBRC 102515 = DSM 9628]